MPYIAPNQHSKAFAIGIALNSLFVCVELYYGFKSNSIALVADAVHKASDVIGLGLVWFSYYMAQWQPNYKFTYGFKKATIIAACVNSIILMFAIGNLFWESIQRLISPEEVISSIVIWVSVLGVIINSTTALLFLKDKKADLNIQTAFLNMALDTLISLAVVIGGLFIGWKNWFFIDPLLGIVIATAIIFSIWQLFKESITLILHGVPEQVNLHEVIEDIEAIDGIISYHELHIWALSTNETAFSVHLTTSAEDYDYKVVTQLSDILRDKYHIMHSTIQLEIENRNKDCLN